MATASILTVSTIRMRRVRRRLSRTGYAVAGDGAAVRLTRDGAAVVATATADPAALPGAVLDGARALLGLAPRHALTCVFEQPVGWDAVVDLARAVAAEVPLAVLVDLSGAVHLVHPRSGPVDPSPGGRAGTGEILRRMLGGR